MVVVLWHSYINVFSQLSALTICDTSSLAEPAAMSSNFRCPNPLCDKAFRDNDLVYSHISVTGSDCAKWAIDFLDRMLYQSTSADKGANDFDGM
jgi:hypothetical protein